MSEAEGKGVEAVLSDPDIMPALKVALAETRIVPYFQPIVLLGSGSIVGFEVLARWQDERFGHLSPAIFIPLIEGAGLLDDLLDTLLTQALTAARGWPDDLFLAFNVSPTQLLDAGLPDRIRGKAVEAGILLSRIHVEITETALIDNLDRARAVLKRIVDLGCHAVIDDFGTGYASLNWILDLPITKIKIDRLFVDSMLSRKESRKIVTAVVGLGRSLGLRVVAEGVETPEQAEFLSQISCELGQGYLFGKAIPASQIPDKLERPPPYVPSRRQERMSIEQGAYQIASMYRGNDLTIGFVDPGGVLIDASESFVNRLGLPSHQAIGRTLKDLSTPEFDLDAAISKKNASSNRHGVIESTSPSGRTDVLIAHDVCDEGGDLLGTSILGIEITDLRNTQKNLESYYDQFDFIIRQCPHLFWAMDRNGKLIYANPRWEEISGMPVEKVSTEEVYDFIDPAHRAFVAERWAHSLKTGEIFDLDYRHRLADRKMHWVRCWGAPHRDASGEIVAWYGTFSVINPPRPLGKVPRRWSEGRARRPGQTRAGR